jgi:hypothetical protein
MKNLSRVTVWVAATNGSLLPIIDSKGTLLMLLLAFVKEY